MSSGDTLWAWQSYEPAQGDLPDGWSIIAAQVGVAGGPFDTHVLVHRKREIALGWGMFAEAHRVANGHPIRFARLELAAVEAEL